MTLDPLTLARRAAEGQHDAAVRAWVSEACRRILAGDPPDQAFRLTSGDRLRMRNAALLDAARLLDTGETWATAGRVATAIHRFEARILPTLQRNPEHPLDEIDQALQRAFATGCRIPGTQRRLYDLFSD
ncbi:MAG TPA: hypothetical protein PLN31_19635 [Azoarcus taiwanensis]|nr:hypothetical protein [Azoarcus taiwanensis]